MEELENPNVATDMEPPRPPRDFMIYKDHLEDNPDMVQNENSKPMVDTIAKKDRATLQQKANRLQATKYKLDGEMKSLTNTAISLMDTAKSFMRQANDKISMSQETEAELDNVMAQLVKGKNE